jgi:hypothetical protein
MATIPCVCPKKADGTQRHETDTVTLRERLDFRAGLTARNTVIIIKQEDPEANAADILAGLTEVYLLVGIESWTLQDARGKPLEVNRANVRQLMAEHPDEAMTIGDEADGLYSEAVIAPLVKRALTSSSSTPTTGSTSRTTGSVPVPLKRSKRSSTTTTPTDATERMSASRAGDYN